MFTSALKMFLNSSVVTAVTDAYFNLVTLLLPGNGTNGAQNNTFLDSSSNNFTITRNGNTTQGTFTPFSQTGWSNYFSSGNYLTSTAGGSLGSGDFTLECWVNVSAWATFGAIVENTNIGRYQLGFTGTNQIGFYLNPSFIVTSSANTAPLNQWLHVAVCRSGAGANNLSLWINGGNRVQGTSTTNFSDDGLRIGQSFDNFAITGYVSNLRIVKGAALYSGTTFTPPSAPLGTAGSGTTSLLTCQDNRFKDNGASAVTLTPTGTPSVQAFSPFAPTAAYTTTDVGGSGYFDGTGDYLSVADNANLRLGTSAFTIQAWIYRAASGTAHSIIAKGGASTGFVFQVTSGNVLRFTHGTTNVDTTTTIPASSWTHVAAVRTGTGTNEFQLYINGVSSVTATVATDFNQTETLYVGADRSAATTMNGYISGLKYTNGTAESISVPTSPPTATTNVALLTNYTNAGITDATAKNDLETVGNAQISTTQSKFGGSSMYFDGTGDWLSIRSSPDLYLSSGPFTIEAWVYPTTNTAGVIMGRRAAANAQGFFLGYGNITSQKFSFYCGDSNIGGWEVTLTSTNTFAPNQWYYVSVTRDSSNLFTLRVNGVSEATATNSVVIADDTSPLSVGGFIVTNESFNGYLDDVRITKGLARTITSSPTAAFPVQ